MRYVTLDGVEIEVGRVDRRRLDMISLPEPAPPTHSVETWGGIVEQVPDYGDQKYQAQLFDYKVKLWREQMPIIADGIEINKSEKVAKSLEAISFAISYTDERAAFLSYCISELDRNNIVSEILYQSTVTERGLREATKKLGYEWMDRPLVFWGVPKSNGKRGKIAVEMSSAFRSNLSWNQFCDLSGQEQSDIVAFWALEDKLSYLLTKQK